MNLSSDHGPDDAAQPLDHPGSPQSKSLDDAHPGTPEYLQLWLARYYAAMLESNEKQSWEPNP